MGGPDVVDRYRDHVRPGVEAGGGEREDAHPGRRGDEFELLLDLVHGGNPGAVPLAHLHRHVTPLGHRVRVLQQVFGGQVRDRHRLPPRQTVPGGEHDDPGLLEQRPHPQAPLVDGQADQAHVGTPVAQHLGLVVPARAQEPDVDPGVARGEGQDGRRHGDTGHEPDRERPPPLGRGPHPPEQRLGPGEQGGGVLQQLPARGREGGAAAVAEEQGHPQFLLQRPDLP